MNELLPYNEIIFDKNVTLEDILNTLDDTDFGFSVETDSKYPDEIREKTKHFPLAPENKKIIPDIFTPFMNENKNTYTPSEKLKSDWTDEKNYLIQKRMIKYYIKHGMLIDQVHEKISFEQIK